MNKKQTSILCTLALATALAFGAVGCGTLSGQPEPQNIARASILAEEAAYIGASYDLSKTDDRRPIYQATVGRLDLMISQERYTREDLLAAVADIMATEIKSPEARGAIHISRTLFRLIHTNADEAERRELIAAVVPAIRNGLDAALTQSLFESAGPADSGGKDGETTSSRITPPEHA